MIFTRNVSKDKTSSMEVTPQPSVLHSRYPVYNNVNTASNINNDLSNV